MFIISKLASILTAPANIITLLLVVGAILLWSPFFNAGRFVVSGAAFLIVAVIAFPIGHWIARPLEQRFHSELDLPGNVDGIIVLGGTLDPELTAIYKQPILGDSAERLTAFAALSRRYPNARMVFSGGSGRIGGGVPEAAEVGRLLKDLDVPSERVIFESASRNTYENALYVSRLVTPKPKETWILITSAWHMPRAMGVFRAFGFEPYPYQVDYRTSPARAALWKFDLGEALGLIGPAMREWIGLTAYRLMGRTSALFPGP